MRCNRNEFIKGGYYHVYNHATAGELLFREPDDYRYFTRNIIEKAIEMICLLISWCLMPNHYHFLVRQDGKTPIFKLFNSVIRGYVNHYNFKYERCGRLFNKLQHRNVIDNKYMLMLCLYIHLNPVKDGFANEPENWRYSDYCNWVNESKLLIRDDIFECNGAEYKMLIYDRMKQILEMEVM